MNRSDGFQWSFRTNRLVPTAIDYAGERDMSGQEDFEPEGASYEEREALRQDLVDVEVLKEILSPKGIKGTVFYCPDCDEDHYLTWELLAGNLKELLDQGESPIHEPAFDPNPDDYVSWDYARGFLDGYESFQTEEMTLLVARLSSDLSARGWPVNEIKELLAKLDLQMPPEAGR